MKHVQRNRICVLPAPDQRATVAVLSAGALICSAIAGAMQAAKHTSTRQGKQES